MSSGRIDKRFNTAKKIFLAFVLLACSRVSYADRGDILHSSTGLSNKDLSDICRDSSDGSYWATSSTLGEIYHLDSTLTVQSQDQIASPHGSFNILSNPVLLRGIAYREDTGTLLTLALRRSIIGGQVSYEMHEIDTQGTLIAQDPVILTVPEGPEVDYRGLTWDPLTSNVWTLDSVSGDFVQFNLGGSVVRSNSQVHSESCKTTFGKGIHFELHANGATGFLHGAQGEVIDLGPSTIYQHTLISTLSGAPLSLEQVPGDDIYGFVTSIYLHEAVNHHAMVLIDNESDIHVLDRGNIQSAVTVPPTSFTCTLNENGFPELNWINHGNGANGAYIGQIQLRRNGQLIQSFAGGTTSFTDLNPPNGETTYSLIAQSVLSSSDEVFCTITIGPGGLMGWHCFNGASIFDLCRDPSNGDIYVTDPLNAEIHVLSADLSGKTDGDGLPIILPSPFGSNDRLGGIAFYSDGNEGAGTLMVTSLDRVIMRQMALDGTPIEAGIPMSPPSGNNIGSGMTYNPSAEAFAYIDIDSDQLIHISRTGNPVPGFPPTHPPLTGIFHRGIAYEPVEDRYFSAFENGSRIEQLFGTGSSATQFSFSLSGLSQGSQPSESIGGLEITGNSILVANRAANVIYRLFLGAEGGEFIRGDSDMSGLVEMNDAVIIAEYLFVEGPAPACPDAADSNDDGFLDISDPVYLLYHLFLGGDEPPSPYPSQGNDPTFLDGLDCPL